MQRAFRIVATALVATLLSACAIEDGEPSGTIPTPEAGAARTTKAAVGEACKIASDCDSMQCFVGGQFSYCSLKCGTDNALQVCVPPVFNGMCNKQGYCRKP